MPRSKGRRGAQMVGPRCLMATALGLLVGVLFTASTRREIPHPRQQDPLSTPRHLSTATDNIKQGIQPTAAPPMKLDARAPSAAVSSNKQTMKTRLQTPTHRSSETAGLRDAAFDPILVLVTISPVPGPLTRADRILAIAETWGKRVQVVFLSRNVTADTPAAFRGPPGGEQRWPDIWQLPVGGAHGPVLRSLGNTRSFAKSKSAPPLQMRAMRHSFRRVLELQPRPKWIFWCNDHTFLVPENLRSLLASYRAHEHHYLGLRLHGPCCGTFNSGAAGFAVSVPALEALVSHWNQGDDKGDGSVHKDCEREIAPCLRLVTNGTATPGDTRTASGAERFHAYGVVRMLTGTVDDWFRKKKAKLEPPESVPAGIDCCATDTVSFHYVGPAETRLLDRIVTMEDSSRRAIITEGYLSDHWPASRLLGGYSQAWPRRDREAQKAISQFLRSKFRRALIAGPQRSQEVPKEVE